MDQKTQTEVNVTKVLSRDHIVRSHEVSKNTDKTSLIQIRLDGGFRFPQLSGLFLRPLGRRVFICKLSLYPYLRYKDHHALSLRGVVMGGPGPEYMVSLFYRYGVFLKRILVLNVIHHFIFRISVRGLPK